MHLLEQWLWTRRDFAPRETLAVSGDIFVVTTGVRVLLPSSG